MRGETRWQKFLAAVGIAFFALVLVLDCFAE